MSHLMRTEVWARVDAVLGEALDMEEPLREEFARRQLAQDPEALSEVLRLLSRHGDANKLFAHSPLATWSSLQQGSRIGPWELLGPLGAGGMGVVWKARRAEGDVEMFAVIKVLPSYFSTLDSKFARRFQEEKRILARMDHPNIARMLEVSAGPNESPNYVMEFVDGEPLLDFVHRIPNRGERLRVFAKICDAVQYAHGMLVVHRDLKPANILVRSDGEPKLLDFGIARILDQHTSGQTMRRAYSLDYASPEQMLGQPARTASDIYSLGILLCELLTGKRTRTWEDKTIAECISSIANEKVGTREDLGSEAFAVVRKATAALPEHRYRTAGELGEDIQRLIDGSPVRAKPGGIWRDAWFFARQHRWAAIGLSLGFAALAVTGAWGLREARRAQASEAIAVQQAEQMRSLAGRERKATDEAEAQRDLAQKMAAEARARAVDAAERSSDALRLAERTIAGARQQVARLERGTGASVVILEYLVRDLEEITGSGRNADWYRLRGMARFELADLYGGFNSNLGQAEKRTEMLRLAIADLDRAVTLAPSDGRARLAGFDAKFQRDQRQLTPEQWRAYEKRASVMAASLNHNYPSLRFVSRFYFHYGSKLRGNEKVRAWKSALSWNERALKLRPDEAELKRDAALLHKYLSNNVPVSEQMEHAEAAVRLDRERVAADGASAAAKMDLAFSIVAMGDALAKQGLEAEASRYFEEGYRIRKELVLADPQNVFFSRALTYPWVHRGWMLAKLSDRDQLRSHLNDLEWVLATANPKKQSWEFYIMQQLPAILNVLDGDTAAGCARLADARLDWKLVPNLAAKCGRH
jgi:tetratricopeptide (TPR) repeat protein